MEQKERWEKSEVPLDVLEICNIKFCCSQGRLIFKVFKLPNYIIVSLLYKSGDFHSKSLLRDFLIIAILNIKHLIFSLLHDL